MVIPSAVTKTAQLLNVPVFGSTLKDTDPDPGYFGPGSITWKVMGEPGLMLGGGRALLIQAAHPLVAEGALQTTGFERDPFGRMFATGQFVGTVAFGTHAEADAAIQRVNRVHTTVHGTLRPEHATEAWPAGTPYDATDPALVRFVHAAMVQTLAVSFGAIGGKLRPGERDRFVCEWNPIGIGLGMRPEDAFRSWRHLCEYLDTEIAEGRVMPGGGSHRVARTILGGPSPLLEPAWPALTLISRATLPAPLRRAFGADLTLAERLELPVELGLARNSRRAMRVATSLMLPVPLTIRAGGPIDRLNPRRIRQGASAEYALRRTLGQLQGGRRPGRRPRLIEA